jgi:hypothetical protein
MAQFPSKRRREMRAFRLPTEHDRSTFIGSTGSGKTVFALWTISLSDLYEKMPLIVVDYKRDDHIAKLRLPEIGIDKPLPEQPGIYVLRPDAMGSENWRQNPIEQFFRRVWERGNTWLYFDEIYMVPGSNPADSSPALRAIFTTGRSRKIPVYSLMQRPVGVLRYPVTEASHRVMFSVTDARDIGTMRAFVPQADLSSVFGEDGNSFQPFHALWRDVSQRKSFEFSPCPPVDQIIDTISSKIRRKQSASWV